MGHDVLIPVMLRWDTTILFLNLGSKLKVAFNICLIEVLSMFWVKMLWF